MGFIGLEFLIQEMWPSPRRMPNVHKDPTTEGGAVFFLSKGGWSTSFSLKAKRGGVFRIRESCSSHVSGRFSPDGPPPGVVYANGLPARFSCWESARRA